MIVFLPCYAFPAVLNFRLDLFFSFTMLHANHFYFFSCLSFPSIFSLYVWQLSWLCSFLRFSILNFFLDTYFSFANLCLNYSYSSSCYIFLCFLFFIYSLMNTPRIVYGIFFFTVKLPPRCIFLLHDIVFDLFKFLLFCFFL